MTAIKVPPLGESIVEATVSRWLKHEGDAVSPGESLVELETDKITVEVPAMMRGVLTKRTSMPRAGGVVKVDDSVLCEIDEAAAGRQPVDLRQRRRRNGTRRAGDRTATPAAAASPGGADPQPRPRPDTAQLTRPRTACPLKLRVEVQQVQGPGRDSG